MGITGFGKPGGPFDVKKDAQGNVVFSDFNIHTGTAPNPAPPTYTATTSTIASGTRNFIRVSMTVTNQTAYQGATIKVNGATTTSTPTLTTAGALTKTLSGTYTSPTISFTGRFKSTIGIATNPSTRQDLSPSQSFSTTTVITGTGSAVTVRGRLDDILSTGTLTLKVNGGTVLTKSSTTDFTTTTVKTGTFTSPKITIIGHNGGGVSDDLTIRAEKQTLAKGIGGTLNMSANAGALYTRV